jgi:hypothetical protein
VETIRAGMHKSIADTGEAVEEAAAAISQLEEQQINDEDIEGVSQKHNASVEFLDNNQVIQRQHHLAAQGAGGGTLSLPASQGQEQAWLEDSSVLDRVLSL